VRQLHAAYMASAARFFALAPSDPARRTLYFDHLLPTFTEVTNTANQILEINQQNMVEANNEASNTNSPNVYSLAPCVKVDGKWYLNS